MRRLGAFIMAVISLTIMFASAGLAVAVTTMDVRSLHVLTSSMRPTITPGDIVLVRVVPTHDLRRGMVILTNDRHGDPYLHRIVSVRGSTAAYLIRTRGDANSRADAWITRITKPATLVMFARIPLGWMGRPPLTRNR